MKEDLKMVNIMEKENYIEAVNFYIKEILKIINYKEKELNIMKKEKLYIVENLKIMLMMVMERKAYIHLMKDIGLIIALINLKTVFIVQGNG